MTKTTVTHIAAIAAVSDVVAGDFCDVGVYEAEGTSVYYSGDETETVEYAATGPCVFAAETTVRTDDPEVWPKVQADAERILAEHGWHVVTEWTVSANAMYADVEHAEDDDLRTLTRSAGQLDRAAVAARYGIQPDSVTAAVNRGSLPPPDGYVGRSPWWWESTLDAHQRPGRGAGGGRPPRLPASG